MGMLRIESLKMSPNFSDYITYQRVMSQTGSWSINSNGPRGQKYLWYSGANYNQLVWPMLPNGPFSTLGHSLRIFVTPTLFGEVAAYDVVNASSQVTVRFNGNGGFITVMRGNNASNTVLLQTAPGQFPLGAWFWTEVLFTIGSGTSGAVKVWVQGNLVVNLTGVNTQATSRSVADTTLLGEQSGNFGAMDFHWWDTTGAYNNNALGDRGVVGFLPNASGDSSGYTPNGLSPNYRNAANAPPVAGDFNAAATVGAIDLFLGASTGSTTNIAAAQVSAIGYKTDSGSRSQAVALKSGGTLSVGSAKALPDSGTSQSSIWETDPSTGVPILPSALPALQWGYQLSA